MNKGQSTIAIIIVGGFTSLASIMGAWFSGSSAAQQKINDVQFALSQQIGTEKLERTNADTELKGRYRAIDDKLDKIMEGLGIKYALPPVAETFSTKDERIKNNAPLLEGVDKNGIPINENGKTKK